MNWVKRVWGVRRCHRLLALAAGVGIALGAGGLVLAHHEDGTGSIDGPHGAFPPTLAAAAPLHTARQVATLEYGSTVYRGLGIEAGPGSQQVTAVNLHTGKPYWRYVRRSNQIAANALDEATGRPFLLWRPASNTTGGRAHVTVIDTRKGRIGWDHTLPAEASDPYRPSIAIGRQVVAIVDSDWMTGLDRTTGKRRWTVGDRCDRKTATMTQETILTSQDCGQGGEVSGHDLAAGVRRWTRPTAGWFPGITDAAHQSVGVGTLDAGRFVI